mgnify:CR=1 FL=1
MKSINLKSKFLKCLMLPSAAIVYASANALIQQQNNKHLQTAAFTVNNETTFDNDVVNTINFQEVNYWHDSEPEAKVTAVNTVPVQFNITANNVIANVNNTRKVASKQVTSNVKQVTAFQTK